MLKINYCVQNVLTALQARALITIRTSRAQWQGEKTGVMGTEETIAQMDISCLGCTETFTIVLSWQFSLANGRCNFIQHCSLWANMWSVITVLVMMVLLCHGAWSSFSFVISKGV